MEIFKKIAAAPLHRIGPNAYLAGALDLLEKTENFAALVTGGVIVTPSAERSAPDLADFKAAVVEYVPALRRYARALVQDPEGADDLVHDAVLKAIEKNHLWKRGTNLKAWLFTILHNHFINQYRRHAVRPPQLPLEDHEHYLANDGNQSGHVELQQLKTALHRLPDDQRAVVMLVSIQGLSYEEAAEIAGVPLGTIRSRLSRARQTLKRALEGVPESGERAA